MSFQIHIPPFQTPGDISAFAEEVQSAYFMEKGTGVQVDTVWSPDEGHTNKVIYLHGYGDGPNGMAQLARELHLPQTDSHVLTAWGELPLGLDGRGWYTNAALLSELYGKASADAMEKKERSVAVSAMKALLAKNRCKAAFTYLVGHGQGAELALWAASVFPVAGVVSIDLPQTATLPAPEVLQKTLRDVNLFERGSSHPHLKGLPLLQREGVSGGVAPLVKWFATHLPQEFLSLAKNPDVVTIKTRSKAG